MAIKILRLSGKCLQRLSKIEAVEFYPFFCYFQCEETDGNFVREINERCE